MEVIHKTPKEGKTTELIRKCAGEGGYIVCCNINDANRIFQMSQNMELNIPFPITFKEFIKREYSGRRISCFHIDDADRCLQSLSDVEIKTVTLTREKSELFPV